ARTDLIGGTGRAAGAAVAAGVQGDAGAAAAALPGSAGMVTGPAVVDVGRGVQAGAIAFGQAGVAEEVAASSAADGRRVGGCGANGATGAAVVEVGVQVGLAAVAGVAVT